MNDSPVDCQSRKRTERRARQGDRLRWKEFPRLRNNFTAASGYIASEKALDVYRVRSLSCSSEAKHLMSVCSLVSSPPLKRLFNNKLTAYTVYGKILLEKRFCPKKRVKNKKIKFF